LTVWFTADAVQAWQAEPRTTRGGQPDYSPLAILTALTLRAVFRLPFRQTEGLIGSVIGLLGLDLAVPDHTTLCRRAETLEVPRPRPRSDGEPMHLLVDSTGLKLCGAGEWLIEKHGTSKRRSWRKLVWGSLRQGLIAAEPPCPSVSAKWTWPSWVGRRSEGSSPSGAMPRATSLYSVGSVEAGP
jgi:hypothetical protein